MRMWNLKSLYENTKLKKVNMIMWNLNSGCRFKGEWLGFTHSPSKKYKTKNTAKAKLNEFEILYYGYCLVLKNSQSFLIYITTELIHTPELLGFVCL